jgi:hypothetical protein
MNSFNNQFATQRLREEGSVTGTGATFTPGTGEQAGPIATKKIVRKKLKPEQKDVEPKLAAGKAKIYMKDKWGWKDAPSIPNRPSKGGFIYKQLFEELSNFMKEIDPQYEPDEEDDDYGSDNPDDDYGPTMEEDEISEAYVPSNIKEFAKRKGITSLVNKVAGWAEKAGKGIRGGTAVGKNYNTLVLDLGYQDGAVRINISDDYNEPTIELYGEPVYDAKSFSAVLNSQSDNENLSELDANDPVLMKVRAAAYQKSQPKSEPVKTINPDYKAIKNADKIKVLLRHRAELMSDMEQEAEPEGGPIADRYGRDLNRIDKALAKLRGQDSETNPYMDKAEIERRAAMMKESYSRFKNETKTRGKSDQFHQAVREVRKKVQEINRLFEYVSRLKSELSEGEGGLKYKVHTEKALAKIKEMVAELNQNIKKFK